MGQIDFDNKNVSYAGEESLKQEVASTPHSCMVCKHCGYANVPYCRMKRRLNRKEYSVEEIISKIVGKCTEATSICLRVAFGLRELYLIKNWLQRADALGLWNNRLDFLHQALGLGGEPAEDAHFVMIVFNMYDYMKEEWFTQDDVIACKSVEDFEGFVQRYPIIKKERGESDGG